MPTNVEIKARSTKNAKIRAILKEENAVCKGTDKQKDTYFNVNFGRLKLREGIIENNLIHYKRSDTEAAKTSEVLLYKTLPDTSLKAVLSSALGVLITVSKEREIYFIDNVKIHLDKVENLGEFVEIEAIDTDGSISKEKLQQQCEELMQRLGIEQDDLEAFSYSDLLFQARLGNKALLVNS